MVLHYHDTAADTQPALAIVTRVGLDAIDVAVVHSGMAGTFPYSGVHHRVAQADRADAEGLWLPRTSDVVLLKLLLAQGILEWDGESKYVETKKATETPTPPSSPPPPPPPPK